MKIHQKTYKHVRKSDNFHEMEGSLTQRDSERMMASPSQTNSRLQFQKRNNELKIQELKLNEIQGQPVETDGLLKTQESGSRMALQGKKIVEAQR